MLIERLENTLSDGQKMPKSPPKWGFEPNFSALGPNFSHARMVRTRRAAAPYVVAYLALRDPRSTLLHQD